MVLRFPTVLALLDGFPVSQGHVLIVPHRHIPTWFDATDEERAALFGAIAPVCELIKNQYGAEGFNFGINSGAAAGQTVPHLHLHVIPRRTGDMEDPRGGVRHVIPSKGNYLSASERPATPVPVVQDAGAPRIDTSTATMPPAMLTTGHDNPLLPQLQQHLARASQMDVAVAFVMPSGVGRLLEHLDDMLARGGRLRLVTGDYLGVTDPNALHRLLDLQAVHGSQKVQLRVYVTNGQSFHPKAYLLLHSSDEPALSAVGLMLGNVAHDLAFVGSSNLSESALLQGVEWNYAIQGSRDPSGLAQARRAFEQLFAHPQTRPIDEAWLSEYRAQRPQRQQDIFAGAMTAEREAIGPVEPPLPVPLPNTIQLEALEALSATRAAGNRAGLVVMATGLGKTWLAAFDVARMGARNILFVAHRDEILKQALATFRRILPDSTLGLYTGNERAPDAQILFASIQTLGRANHLRQFARHAFDYIVVDEFHHAAAPTYRRLIEHFEPQFMLGLTATPERTDGGDLLGLCAENLVYRCGVPRGIELELLSPYRYFGVPDEVDYAQIPWRSARFDEDALTAQVATTSRALNVFEQWQKHAGERTIAFCVSQRHADFMREFFKARQVLCAAVHAGQSTDPRTLSLEALARGEMSVVFAVDMFNEGVDVPAIDTVMMLRPTESQVIWLQQFGRGLRKQPGKTLKVIDYIGNHRSFLTKVRALFGLDSSAGTDALRMALLNARASQLVLPPGCEVTYELQALDILLALLPRGDQASLALKSWYEEFLELHGQRPRAIEAMHDGYLPRSAKPQFGSWLGFVQAQSGLDALQQSALQGAQRFLTALESTAMTRSFKMLVLQAMLDEDELPGQGMAVGDLARAVLKRVRRSARLQSEFDATALNDLPALERLLIKNPIAAWTGDGAMKGVIEFRFENGVFRYAPEVPLEQREAFQGLVRELVEWRLAEYLDRAAQDHNDAGTAANVFVLKVSHSNGKPILFLPAREGEPNLPQGWQSVLIDDQPHQANFVKVAVNVIRPAKGEDNVIASVLRGWFGADAGLPGTDFKVSLTQDENANWVMAPLGQREREGLLLFKSYSREQIPPLFGEVFNEAIWNSGYVKVSAQNPRHLCLLVTLDKAGMVDEHQYRDRFLTSNQFEWHSQNRTLRASKDGELLSGQAHPPALVHLFVRKTKKAGSRAAPFVYCGPVQFESWDGDQPITIRWRLGQPLPERLVEQFMTNAAGS